MAQLTVRNVPKEIVTALKIRAAKSGHSAEAEHRRILESALRPNECEWWTKTDTFRKKTAGTKQTDSAKLLRRMRDER